MSWILVLLGVLAFVLFLWFVKKKRVELEQTFQKRFAGKSIIFIDKFARIIAQESHGYSQKVGMGYLVLTPDELYFGMQLLNREISIPTKNLTGVGETRRMKGKNPLRTMLKIDYKTAGNNRDALALLVKDLPRWKQEISNVIGKKS